MSHRWTAEEIAEAFKLVKELGGFESAAKRLSEDWGRKITRGGLYRVLAHRGLAGPERVRPLPPPIESELGDEYPHLGRDGAPVGLLADLHAGSGAAAIDVVPGAVEWLVGQGARDIVVAGDLVDADYHPGQVYDLTVAGLDGQTREVLRAIPQPQEGVRYWLLGGNHGRNGYRKRSGVDPMLLLVHRAQAALGRQDLIYLDPIRRRVLLGPDRVTADLWHPDSISASTARKRTLARREPPDVLILGHYHRWAWIDEAGLITIQLPGLQKTTRWLAGRGLEAEVGAVVVQVTRDKDGAVAVSYRRRTWT